MVLRLLAALVLVAVTAGMWSDSVAAWWGSESSDDSTVPGPIRFLLDLRPDVGEADLHLIVWAVTAALVVIAVGSTRWLVGVAATVGAWSVAVEALQPVVSDTRGFSWGDVLGNLLGVALGAALVALWWRVRPNPTVPPARGTAETA